MPDSLPTERLLCYICGLVKEFAYIHEEGHIPEGLEGIPFLQSFGEGHIDDLLSSAALLDCDPDDHIIQEGESESRIYILMSGEVRVEKKGELIATLDRQGAIFGELAAIDDDERSASVVANTKVICLAIDQKFLRDIKPPQEDPAFYAALYKAIAKITADRLKAASIEIANLEHELQQLKSQAGVS